MIKLLRNYTRCFLGILFRLLVAKWVLCNLMILIFEQVDPKLFSNIGNNNIDAINTSVTGVSVDPGTPGR